jgi:cardiolipin synthase
MHHKIVVADGKVAMIGGMNIADKYHGTETENPWLDHAAQIEGEMAQAIQELCMDIYLRKWRQHKRKLSKPFHGSDGTILRILRNDWVMRKHEIDDSYISALRSAQKEIIIVNSYFLPGKRLTNVLIKAADRGKLKIKLVLSGISDVPTVRRATCYLYAGLLRHNIELYEWHTSVLHSKIAVADQKWATIGSFNLNHLSSYGCIEMNVDIKSPAFGAELTAHLEEIISQCEPITQATLQARKRLFTNVVNWCSYVLVRVAMIIVTYVPYRRWLKRFGNE